MLKITSTANERIKFLRSLKTKRPGKERYIFIRGKKSGYGCGCTRRDL